MLFSKRNSRRSVLIEVNPYQILAAGFDRPDDGAVTIDCAAEFDGGDEAGLRQWLVANFEKQNAWVPAIASFLPPEALIQRESIAPRKLADSGYLNDLAKDQYKLEAPDNWRLSTLSPLEGVRLGTEGTQRPALICGVSQSDVHATQQRLLDLRLLPYRLELGTLPLLGAVVEYQERMNEKRAVVVVVIEHEHTTAFIIGKEGVHTPAPVRHGFSSIVQAARREFDLKDAAEVRARLHHADDELLLRASKFVRAIGRDLKPLVDSYEMTTGQPVGEIFCAYLPPALSWIAEPLAHVIGRAPFKIDCPAWQGTVKITPAAGVAPLGQHWLGALSLIAQLPGAEGEPKSAKGDATYHGPWRLDCRISAALPSGDLVRRRFISNAIAGTLAASVLMGTCWQLYRNNSLSTEISFWTQRIRDNQQQATQLKGLTRTLNDQTNRLDLAYNLMASPYILSDLVMQFGRTRLENMTIESLNGFPGGVVLHGRLTAPSEQATQTLRGYVESLRRDPEFSRLFSNIALTSLDREGQGEVMNFEVALKLRETKP